MNKRASKTSFVQKYFYLKKEMLDISIYVNICLAKTYSLLLLFSLDACLYSSRSSLYTRLYRNEVEAKNFFRTSVHKNGQVKREKKPSGLQIKRFNVHISATNRTMSLVVRTCSLCVEISLADLSIWLNAVQNFSDSLSKLFFSLFIFFPLISHFILV